MYDYRDGMDQSKTLSLQTSLSDRRRKTTCKMLLAAAKIISVNVPLVLIL